MHIRSVPLFAALILFVVLAPRAGHGAPLELPPTFVTQWRTSNDRLPYDLFATGTDDVYLVDLIGAGEARTVTGAHRFAFSTVDPISNDFGNLADVTVAADGRVFAADLPGSGQPVSQSRLWRFSANGMRLGSATLPGVTVINSVVPLNPTTLLVATYHQSVGSFLTCSLDGVPTGTWGPTFPAGLDVSRVDMAVGPNGDVFVVDGLGNRVMRFTSGGTLITSWGHAGTGEGEFDQPIGIAVDSDGNVYVADHGNNRVQKFAGDGTFLVQWGGSGGAFPRPPLSLTQPRAIACLPNGIIVVGTRDVDRFNSPISVVKVFQASSTPTEAARVSWGSLKARYR